MSADDHILIYDEGMDLGATVDCTTESTPTSGTSPGDPVTSPHVIMVDTNAMVVSEVFSLTLLPPVPIPTLRDRLDMLQPVVVHH